MKTVFQRYGDEGWVTIAALVPGRTKKMQYHLNPNRGTIRGKEDGTLNKEPDLWQYPHCPSNEWSDLCYVLYHRWHFVALE